MSIFLFGAGYSARAFAAAAPNGAPAITGTTRSTEKFPILEKAGIAPLAFDGETLSTEVRAALAEATYVVVSAAPNAEGDPVLRLIGGELEALAPKLRWIGYLSTVGVYGDHDGAWIDETSPCRPVSQRSIDRLKAEESWQRAADHINRPLAILRLSGIYGPGRNAFINLANGTAKRLVKPGQVFNRIHVSDIAGALWHLLEKRQGGVFNVTDDRPAPPQEVVAYAAALAGVQPPPEVDFATAKLSPMQRSFYGENKRVSNSKLKDTGFTFAYPNYDAGLSGLWSGDWRGDGDGDARSPIRRNIASEN